jgi:hypothetical protein
MCQAFDREENMPSARVNSNKTVGATDLRDSVKDCLRAESVLGVAGASCALSV